MHRDDSGLCQAHRVGVPEASLINFIKHHLPGDGVLIDCGAHMGVYSILLLNVDKVFSLKHNVALTFNHAEILSRKTNIIPENSGNVKRQNTPKKNSYIVSEDGGGSTFVKPKDQKILDEQKVR